uniref:Uncharacterized protein n=1 Tax=Nelumbo nucifera TaxID=4432 RepID=A0A822YPQ9_NELNU|nr:TPA_asm: hypothetical protein HUJ06_005210 [Nelumbo nucifera]
MRIFKQPESSLGSSSFLVISLCQLIKQPETPLDFKASSTFL